MAPADEATQTPPSDAQAPQTPPESDGSAPPDKDWKAEYARLRKDYDAKAARLNEVEKAVKPEEPVAQAKGPEADIDFKIENAGRIKLVKDDYQKHLSDLQAAGAKLSPSLMEKALKLAESEKGITSKSEASRQEASASAPSVVNREASASEVTLTEADRAFGVTPQIKEKWKHLVEGQG